MIKSNPAYEKRFTRNGQFESRPKGIMICDSWNNGFFKFEQTVIDTARPDWPRVWSEYLKKYSTIDQALFFPTHYVVDSINDLPQIISTRPISYRSLIPGYEDWITVMLIGDSDRDVYTPRYYIQLADLIINPICEGIQSWKQTPELDKNIKLLNLGRGFIPQMLERYFR